MHAAALVGTGTASMCPDRQVCGPTMHTPVLPSQRGSCSARSRRGTRNVCEAGTW